MGYEGEVPGLPFTAAQKAHAETDALTGGPVNKINPVDLTVTEEGKLDGEEGGFRFVFHYKKRERKSSEKRGNQRTIVRTYGFIFFFF